MFSEEDREKAIKSDLPYILCETCDVVVKRAMKEVKDMRAELPSYKKASSRVAAMMCVTFPTSL